MVQDVARNILPFLKMNEREFVADASFSMSLRALMDGVKKKYRNIDQTASKIATSAVTGEAVSNTKRFTSGIEKATGVPAPSLGRIISTENLQDVIQSQIANNVDLIQSIPDQYFKQISTTIYQAVAEGQTVGSIAKQIQHITGTTRSRAKLIARDQTSKTNAFITQQRQQDLGVVEYVWNTNIDGRERPTHKANNGKVFRWDSPPKTGHPGHEVNCRCTARAVIVL